MCDPVTAIAAGGTALSVASSYQQAVQQNMMAEMNAKIMEQNSMIAEQQARIEEKKGKEQEKRHRLRMSKLKGEQRSGFASSGVVVDQGSALDTLMDTIQTEELDAQQIRENAALASWGKRAQAQGFRNQAAISRANKRSPGMAALSAGLQGGSTILGTKGGQNFFKKGFS